MNRDRQKSENLREEGEADSALIRKDEGMMKKMCSPKGIVGRILTKPEIKKGSERPTPLEVNIPE